ncbi:hypothetical protein [Methylocystis parvus]|uniref:hypothetical protein n=1 Tax=Methylocystis parvus TaxID=134 RepID=UPI003C7959CA
MSLVDKFDDQIEPAFTRSFDRESARRQFRVSVLLVAAMATAAFVLGFALPINSARKGATPIADNIEFSGRLVSVDR